MKKKRKLIPWYINILDTLEDIGFVSCRLELLLGFLGVHPLFNAYMLKRYHGDRDYTIKLESILLDEDLFYKRNRGRIKIDMFES